MRKLNKIMGCMFCLLLLLTGCSQLPVVGKPAQDRAKIEFVNKDHKMARLIFAGGFLRTSPEMVKENIVLPAPKGSQGIFYGKRKINGIDWAKVTTREGVTGWYGLSKDAKGTAPAALEITNKNYQVSYPQVSGIPEEAAAKINEEIAKYLSVFNYVAGPVGNPLQCQITYNQNNLLSIMFFTPSVRYRYYEVGEINNYKRWQEIRKYCYMTDFYSDAKPDNLYVAINDLQYGMVFDVRTGKRMQYRDFLRKDAEGAVQDKVAELGSDAYLAPDNFYLEDNQRVSAFVEHGGSAPGRSILKLNELAKKDL